MARFGVLFRCLAEAICARGLRALVGLVPFGDVLFEVASDTLERLRRVQGEGERRAGLEAAAQAPPQQVQQEVAAVVRDAHPEQAVQERLAAYLTLVPSAVRQSLRRPADPAGLTLPPALSLRRPEDLLPFLPARLPLYRPGDRPAGLGDWVLEELLGVGGVGEVWKARHAYFDGVRPVALKFCTDPAAKDRLLRHEAAVLNQVMRQGKHPGVVPLLDTYLGLDPPCLKYEYVPGGDLSELIHAWQRSPANWRVRSAARVMQRLAAIVGAMHRLSPPVVHRDLKPANILVRRRDGGGLHLRVTDFGIGGIAAGQALAQVRQGTTTRGARLATSLHGSFTPLYASPQQVRGAPPDPRDDVYAQGVIWYQLLTGDMTKGCPTGRAWQTKLADHGMSRASLDLLVRCIEEEAGDRPADAAVVAEELASAAAGQTSAPAPSPVETPAGKEVGVRYSGLFGIDLGTTMSSIAALTRDGRVVVIPNEEGEERRTPSAVLFPAAGGVVVGHAALDGALEQPERVAMLVKRRMGHPTLGRPVSGREFRPEALTALILRKLAQDAERSAGPVRKAVISVPVYFDFTRRSAVRDAGRIAGFEVIDVINSPTAVALANWFRPPVGRPGPISCLGPPAGRGTTLVFELGGGTFNVALVRLSQGRFQTIALEGDVCLGGLEWDDRIIDHVATQFHRQTGTDPRSDPRSLASLHQAAERAKRALDRLEQATVTCRHEGRELAFPLSRTDFEGLTRDLLMRTRFTTQQLLRQAGLGWDEVDQVLLSGPSTRMPMVTQMIQELSGRQPDASLAAAEAVAEGAAIHAGMIAAPGGRSGGAELGARVRELFVGLTCVNVTAHSLGVEVEESGERRNEVLIPKNTPMPAAGERVVHTERADEEVFRFKVLKGEAPRAEACISIWECSLELPPGLPKGAPIRLRYSVDQHEHIQVSAEGVPGGTLARWELTREVGLPDEEIVREAKWVQSVNIQ
jgi:molecular chaperone DnaK